MEQEALWVRTKKEILEKMNSLLEKEALEVQRDFHQLEKEFKKAWTALFEEQKKKFIDEGGKVKDFNYVKKEEDIRFEQLSERFRKKLNESKEQLQRQLEKNLELKRDIISRIRFLSENSENVGAALKKLNELKTEWKNTGEVPGKFFKEIQSDYHKVLDDFHHRLKVYRELLEHDHRRNYELKTEIIEKIKNLPEKYQDNFSEMMRAYRALKKEWEAIGQVSPGRREELMGKLREAEGQIHSLQEQFKQEQEKEYELNAQSKRAILTLLEKILENTTSFKTAEEWNRASDEWISHQQSWKEIGKASESENEILYQKLRELSDHFFGQKKTFFQEWNSRKEQIRSMKRDLLEEAEKWKDSTDWEEGTRKFQILQENWKKIPWIENDSEEGKLYFRFKAACKLFFDRKEDHFQKLRKSIEEEILRRKSFLEELSSVSLPEDKQQAMEKLREIENQWELLGGLRYKEKNDLQREYQQQVQRLQNLLQLNPSELYLLKFENRLKKALASENPEDFFQKENKYLRSQYEEVNQRLKTYENNKAFFRHAKSDNPLLRDLEEKIAKEQVFLQDIDKKRKLLKKYWDSFKEKGREKTERADSEATEASAS